MKTQQTTMRRWPLMLPSLATVALALLSSCGNSNSMNPNGGSNGNSSMAAWNSSISYGTLKDARDGQVYKTVKTGTQTWMAENLNYAGTSASPVGVWYNNSSDNGSTYGRLYTWSEVMAGRTSSSANPSGVQGVCPSGWHVPSDTEWTILTTAIGGESTAGAKLMSTSGWSITANNADNYGFRVLPAGNRNPDGSFDKLGVYTSFWTASEYLTLAWSRYFIISGASVYRIYAGKTTGLSVRCLEGVGTPSTAGAVVAPVFSPSGGTYSDTQSVTLSSSTSGAIIYYTTDGSTPTTSSTKYTSSVVVSTSKTMKAIAVKNGMTTSSVSSATYTISAGTVVAPVFSPSGGTYPSAQWVTLNSSTSGATIYYTTDGSTPTTSSTKYTSSVAVSSSKTVKAIAVMSGMTTSSVGSATYTISPISYGSLTYGGQTYKTVTIGTQMWMAENLNYAVDSSWCYANSADSCSKYGRLYQWAAVMGLDSSYNAKLWSGSLPRQGICPTGWHVPSDTQWTVLVDYLGGTSKAGTKLRSTSGWSGASGNGTDNYGFCALPAGGRSIYGVYYGGGAGTNFWSSSDGGSGVAWDRDLGAGLDEIYRTNYPKKDGFSLRCLKD